MNTGLMPKKIKISFYDGNSERINCEQLRHLWWRMNDLYRNSDMVDEFIETSSRCLGVNDAYWGHGGGKQYQIIDWDNINDNLKSLWFKKGGDL